MVVALLLAVVVPLDAESLDVVVLPLDVVLLPKLAHPFLIGFHHCFPFIQDVINPLLN